MLYAIVAVLCLIADQGLKYWTTLHLELNAGAKEFIPGLIRLRNLHNTGSAFSFLGGWTGARWLFLAVTVAFAVLVILALAKKVIRGEFGRWMAVGVLAGALGNGIDRCISGYVVDMFEFAFFPSFPVFNLADIFITVCGVLFCLYIILHKEPFAAPDAARKGPGGSRMKKPEPRRVEKPVEKPAISAATEHKAAPEKKAAPVRAEDEKAAGHRFASAVNAARGNAPAEKKPAQPNRAKRAEKPAQTEDPFARLKRPVVTHESFLEMTKHKSGDDPFAEWTQPAETPAVREVTPEPVKPESVAEMIEAAEKPAQPVVRPVVEKAPEPVKPEAPKAEEVPHIDVDVTEDAVYSLEDILNEFRDL